MPNHESLPLVSVIVPVHNGAVTLDRALRSVVEQTFHDWELLVVDDASNDETANILKRWAAEDCRIRPFRFDENRGVSAARNRAIENARGLLVSYLDRDDEYYPDHLANISQFRDKADVLFFGYDFSYEDGPRGSRPLNWDPSNFRQDFFVNCIVTPLGVAHRRELWEKVGGFNEMAWYAEDCDIWRRIARTGAKFAFLPLKCGCYHVRRDSISRLPHITPRQSETFWENWDNGRPMFEDGRRKRIATGSPRPSRLPLSEGKWAGIANATLRRKVAFVSPHCVLDFTAGAATATLDGLALLARSDFECQAFCSSRMDAWEDVPVEEILARRGLHYEVRNAQIGAYQGRMILTTYEKVSVTLFNSAWTRGGWINAEEIAAFLAACETFLAKSRPDVLWTYGGDPVSLSVQQLAKRLDIPVLFAVHNLSYRDARAFRLADYVVVPTEFCQQHYWDSLGLASLKLPLVVDPGRVSVENCGSPHRPGPRVLGAPPGTPPLPDGEGTADDTPPASRYPVPPAFVTFINPEPWKGVHVFARIAEVLSLRRPDIPLLIVEGEGKASFLPQLGIDLSGVKNLRIIPSTPDPRQFYARTRLLLVPSLMEDAGFAAMEAMSNGIPVLAGNRGSLPETIGDAGFLFDIPARFTPDTRYLPTPEQVEPWVETIIHLWDDAGEYERRCEAARERARQWHPERLGPVYCEFFGRLTHQPAPPLAPRERIAPRRPMA